MITSSRDMRAFLQRYPHLPKSVKGRRHRRRPAVAVVCILSVLLSLSLAHSTTAPSQADKQTYPQYASKAKQSKAKQTPPVSVLSFLELGSASAKKIVTSQFVKLYTTSRQWCPKCTTPTSQPQGPAQQPRSHSGILRIPLPPAPTTLRTRLPEMGRWGGWAIMRSGF